MLTTFLTTLKTLTRSPAVLLWAIAFPLVLSTLFHMMFGNLDAMYKLKPIAVVIVNDANYQNAKQFATAVEALAADDAYKNGAVLAPTLVANEDAALDALRDGEYYGYILLNNQGKPSYQMDSRRLNNTGDPSQGVIKGILDQYLQRSELLAEVAINNPQMLASPGFIEQLSKSATDQSFTERLQVTASPPSDSIRYYYAVLAFSTFMMAIFANSAISNVQANASALGARRSLGGQSKLRTLLPTLTAAWLLAFGCLLVGFCYIRFVFGVSFGGKEPFVLLALAVSAFAVTFLGALLGSLPLPTGSKSGLVAVLSNFLSLFAGLYGTWSQSIGDFVARELPLLSIANPVRQVADAMFSLYYYDDYQRLMQCLISLLIFGVVFFIASTLLLRRQRYASL